MVERIYMCMYIETRGVNVRVPCVVSRRVDGSVW